MGKSYACAFCGKLYEEIEERVICETKCLKDYKTKEERKKADEMKKKKAESQKAIEAELRKVNDMIKDHYKNYDTIAIHENYTYLKHVFGGTPLFWF